MRCCHAPEKQQLSPGQEEVRWLQLTRQCGLQVSAWLLKTVLHKKEIVENQVSDHLLLWAEWQNRKLWSKTDVGVNVGFISYCSITLPNPVLFGKTGIISVSDEYSEIVNHLAHAQDTKWRSRKWQLCVPLLPRQQRKGQGMRSLSADF